MKAPNKKPNIDIDSVDGNAFGVMGAVRKALKRAGADQEYIDGYVDKCKSGDYDHLLQVSMQYVEFE